MWMWMPYSTSSPETETSGERGRPEELRSSQDDQILEHFHCCLVPGKSTRKQNQNGSWTTLYNNLTSRHNNELTSLDKIRSRSMFMSGLTVASFIDKNCNKPNKIHNLNRHSIQILFEFLTHTSTCCCSD